MHLIQVLKGTDYVLKGENREMRAHGREREPFRKL
jgi:hypothetical protein